VNFRGRVICLFKNILVQNMLKFHFSMRVVYFREYEDGINLLCRIYEPKLGVIQDHIDPKTWDLLLNVRYN